MRETLSDIRQDLRPSIFLPAVSIGFIAGLMVVILEISFAAMIFSGELSHLVARGAGLTLAGAFAACLITALMSPFKSVISLPQDAPAAIFSGAATAMAAGMSMAGQEVFITIVAALILTTLLTALFLFLIARFRLVHFFRYIPYPVIGGFLAGTGWILSYGSLEVMIGSRVSLMGPGSLFSMTVLVLWLPGAVLALALFCILRKFSHFIILPLALVLGLVIFHLTLYLSGVSLEEATKAGFLFESIVGGSLWPVFSWSDLSHVNWTVVLTHAPVLMTIPVITLIGLILNMSGVELASRKEINMEQELMANSLGNTLAGLAGSHPAYSTLSISMLGFKTNAYSRIVGISAALVVLATLIWGGGLISVFPKAVLGGFLMLLGLFFLWDWVIETRKKMTAADYIIVLTIFAVIAWQGFFQGVLLGILLSVVLFVVRFSHVPIIKTFYTGVEKQSPRVRSLPHRKILLENGDRINIFELTGYLFFGSVNSLVSMILSRVEKTAPTGPVYAIIDLGRVSGIDVSATNAFVRLVHKLSSSGTTIIFTAAPSGFLDQLRRHLDQDEQIYFQHFSKIDTALEQVEDRILEKQLSLFENDKTKNGKGRLFDSVADEMMKKLEELEQVEHVLNALASYSVQIDIEKNDILLSPGKEAGGLYWIRQGKVREIMESDVEEVFLADYSSGDIINPAGMFDKKPAQSLFRADTDCHVQFFPLEKIREMEKQRPDLAIKLYSLLLKMHHLTGC
jgi:sulfate permease, SulP family